MKLYLIRHGESVANKEKVFQGWTDVSLSVTGQKQAKSLGEYFKKGNTHFTKIYSSPLKRAVETGQHLLQSSDFQKLVTCNDFRSINVGQWAGLTIENVGNNFPKAYEIWKSRPKNFRFPGGESIADVQTRAESSLFKILEEDHTLQYDICIVTHMITIKVLILSLLDKDLNSIWKSQYTIPNTGIVIFEVTNDSENNSYRFNKIPTETSIPHLV